MLATCFIFFFKWDYWQNIYTYFHNIQLFKTILYSIKEIIVLVIYNAFFFYQHLILIYYGSYVLNVSTSRYMANFHLIKISLRWMRNYCQSSLIWINLEIRSSSSFFISLNRVFRSSTYSNNAKYLFMQSNQFFPKKWHLAQNIF